MPVSIVKYLSLTQYRDDWWLRWHLSLCFGVRGLTDVTPTLIGLNVHQLELCSLIGQLCSIQEPEILSNRLGVSGAGQIEGWPCNILSTWRTHLHHCVLRTICNADLSQTAALEREALPLAIRRSAKTEPQEMSVWENRYRIENSYLTITPNYEKHQTPNYEKHQTMRNTKHQTMRNHTVRNHTNVLWTQEVH